MTSKDTEKKYKPLESFDVYRFTKLLLTIYMYMYVYVSLNITNL